jgi:hypothetical protein
MIIARQPSRLPIAAAIAMTMVAHPSESETKHRKGPAPFLRVATPDSKANMVIQVPLSRTFAKQFCVVIFLMQRRHQDKSAL